MRTGRGRETRQGADAVIQAQGGQGPELVADGIAEEVSPEERAVVNPVGT